VEFDLIPFHSVPSYSGVISDVYEVCPKSNENDFFAQRRRARKGKWRSRQVEAEPRYTV
jgi:hypothetical protein